MRSVLALCAFVLIVAACGNKSSTTTTTAAPGGGSTTSSGGTTATTSGGGASSTTSGGATTGATPKEASADNPSGFGTAVLLPGATGQDASNPKLYHGAGGFDIDLSKCPGDYDPKQGITDSEIKLATSIPKSGSFAGFGLLGDGMNSYFKFVNDKKGGIGGRKVSVEVKDDAYDPAKTKNNIDAYLQQASYAAFLLVLGTPNNLATWDSINQECYPDLYVGTGAPNWGDVQNHPWTTGMQIDYFTEAGLWATWLKGKFPNGAKVAALTLNSDFGKSYSAGFKKAIKGSNIELVKEEFHDPAAPTVTNQYTSLAATNADVFLGQTSGAACTQAMAELDKGSWKPLVIISATCGSLSQFFKPLVDQGLSGADTRLIQYIVDPNDSANKDENWTKAANEIATAAGLDPKQSTYATGMVFAWYASETLRLAATLNGGLTRPNIIIAARSMTAKPPFLIKPLSAKMEGSKDAYLSEGGRMAQYKVSDPKALGSFVPDGAIIDNEGKTGNFADTQKG